MLYDKNTAIALLGVRGMSVSILSAIKKYKFKYILPIIVLKGNESIDKNYYINQYKTLISIVNDKFNEVQIYSPIVVSDFELWTNISLKNINLNNKLFNVSQSPCFLCHLYEKILCIKKCKELKIYKVILDKKPNKDRLSFKNDLVENALEATTSKLFSINKIKLYNPLRPYNKIEDIYDLIENKDIFTLNDPKCAFSIGKKQLINISEEYKNFFNNVLFKLGTFILVNYEDCRDNKNIIRALERIYESSI